MKLSDEIRRSKGYADFDVNELADRVAQLEAENAELKREVARAVVELAQEDKWETPLKRLCKIASIEYPAIATKIEPTSIDVLLTTEESE